MIISRRLMLIFFFLLGGLNACQKKNLKNNSEAGPSIASTAHWQRHEVADLRRPPPREPGPARQETRGQLRAAEQEAASLIAQLKQAGIAPREIASIADMRGYRLYRRRWFGQAACWFEAAVKIDASFELSLFNAARVYALQGKNERALLYLKKLGEIDTPLARQRLLLIKSDDDFSSLRNDFLDSGR